MPPILIRTIACALALAVANPMLALGEAAPPPPGGAPQAAPSSRAFSTEEIDQMTAPIALYPDELLAQLLVAATYPLEIVQAERWLADPANAALKGDQLAAALEPQTWDPSVKSLVPFPQVLKMMSEKLDWTQRLGDAFLAQQADVMSSVQRLRRQAQGTGTLKSNEQQTVVVERDTVVIQPADPQVVYVPTYNPSVVYGTWPYPAYPPVYYPPPPAYYPGYYPGSALAAGIGFGIGVATVGALWGGWNTNWGQNNININASRYNNINAANIHAGRATQLPANSNTWRHDPGHRGGVAYRDPGSRQAFQRQGAGAGAASRDFRGYAGTPRGGAGTSRPPQARATTGQRQGGAAARQTGAAPGAGMRQPSQMRQPSAFQGMGNGAQTRAQSDRGRASMQSAGASRAPRASASGGMRAGGGGGGARGGGRGGRR